MMGPKVSQVLPQTTLCRYCRPSKVVDFQINASRKCCVQTCASVLCDANILIC